MVLYAPTRELCGSVTRRGQRRTAAGCTMQGVTRTPRRPKAQEPATAAAERRLLDFIQFDEQHRPAGWPRPAFTTAELAGLVELDVEIVAGGGFRLIAAGPDSGEWPDEA